MKGVEPSAEIDHRNTDPSDDRWDNLREATTSQNGMNKTGHRDGLKGAYKHRTGRWRSVIQIDGVQRSLGLFDTESEAHAAYIRAAHQLHGEFANTKNKE